MGDAQVDGLMALELNFRHFIRSSVLVGEHGSYWTMAGNQAFRNEGR